MSHSFEMREAGSQVFIGLAEETCGDIHVRIYGPVTICKAELIASQNKGYAPSCTVKYTINALNENKYLAEFCHDTLEQALKYAQEHVEKRKQKVAA